MRVSLILHWLLPCLLTASAAAAPTNLLVNGDFDSGQLDPWVPTGNVSVSESDCHIENEGQIAQIVTLPDEGDYYLAVDASNLGETIGSQPIFLVLTVSQGGNELASTPHSLRALRADRYALDFHAPAGVTKVEITGANTNMRLDNIRLFLLPRSPFTGRYTGSAKVLLTGSVTAESQEIALATRERAAARIERTGRFVILRGTDFIQGILFEDGTFDLRSQGSRRTGKAEISQGRLRLTLPFSVSDNLDRIFAAEGNQDIHVRSQVVITLTKE